jgi:peptide/nickel transport system substrate-binding protein
MKIGFAMGTEQDISPVTSPYCVRRRRKAARSTTGRSIRAAALLAGTVLLASACGAANGSSGSSGSSGNYISGGTFTLGVPVALPSANPYAANSGAGQMVFLNYLAYDSLVNENSQGTFETGLASSWTASATKATFRLRPDVTCSDGSKLTASQVAADLNYVGNPKNQYPWVGNLTPSVPYTATGDNATGTVNVATTSAFPFLLQTLGDVPIVCGQGMAHPSMLTSKSDGTGPFVLQSASQTSYTYVVRKGYTWGPNGASTSAPGTPAKIVLDIVTNPTTAANLLLAGQLSATQVLGPDAKRLVEQHVAQSTVQVQAAGLYFTEDPSQATSDVQVRQALVAAMNFSQLAEVQSQATGQPASRATGLRTGSPLPCAGANALSALPAAGLANAKKLLTQAGWAWNGKTWTKAGKPLQLTIAYEQANEEPLAELLQQEWTDLGAKASLDLLTAQQLTALEQGDANFSVLIGASALTLPTQIEPEVSGPNVPKGQNVQEVSNPTYDRLAQQATATYGAKGCSLWVQAENSVMQRADIVPVANQPVALFLGHNVQAQIDSLRQPVPTSIKLLK